ncbi:MAG: hypothetical protein KY428_06235 [Bacteroidetes bacterium]|nr:hypothetical protein [Bacteroidota bacterium]
MVHKAHKLQLLITELQGSNLKLGSEKCLYFLLLYDLQQNQCLLTRKKLLAVTVHFYSSINRALETPGKTAFPGKASFPFAVEQAI